MGGILVLPSVSSTVVICAPWLCEVSGWMCDECEWMDSGAGWDFKVGNEDPLDYVIVVSWK